MSTTYQQEEGMLGDQGMFERGCDLPREIRVQGFAILIPHRPKNSPHGSEIKDSHGNDEFNGKILPLHPEHLPRRIIGFRGNILIR